MGGAARAGQLSPIHMLFELSQKSLPGDNCRAGDRWRVLVPRGGEVVMAGKGRVFVSDELKYLHI